MIYVYYNAELKIVTVAHTDTPDDAWGKQLGRTTELRKTPLVQFVNALMHKHDINHPGVRIVTHRPEGLST